MWLKSVKPCEFVFARDRLYRGVRVVDNFSTHSLTTKFVIAHVVEFEFILSSLGRRLVSSLSRSNCFLPLTL